MVYTQCSLDAVCFMTALTQSEIDKMLLNANPKL